MRPLCLLALALALLGFSASAQDRYRLTRPSRFFGMCDASAAVAISSNLFVVANDEDNILRLYRNDQPGPPVRQFDCGPFLQTGAKSPEADLEGAARLGNRLFWIASHGRNKEGKLRLNRGRFFATDLSWPQGEPLLTPAGKPYTSLLVDLLADARLLKYRLAEAASRAPKEAGALNIEGLAATPEGHLLIGFRNPVPKGKALLIPLLNPNDVVTGKRPRFDAPIELDLGGLGIRDLFGQDGRYLILAGSWHGGGPFHLYRWDGTQTQPLTVQPHWSKYNPEAIVFYPERGWRELQLLSDDGTLLVEGVPAKALPDPRRKTFRGFWIEQ